MKNQHLSILILAVTFFTIGGYMLANLQYFKMLVAMPFGIGLVLICVANSLSGAILKNLDNTTVYLVHGQSLSRKGYLLRVEDMSNREWIIADTEVYPPQGFKEKYSWGTWLVPIDKELSEDVIKDLVFFGGRIKRIKG